LQLEKYYNLATLSIILLRVLKVDIAITPGNRGYSIELLLSSNIIPRFENTKYKEICLPDLSG
jgi:hypothetical protein